MAIKEVQTSVAHIIPQHHHNRKRQYRPLSTKSWILVLYMLAMLACFTILQVMQLGGEAFTELKNEKRHVRNKVNLNRRQSSENTAAAHATLADPSSDSSATTTTSSNDPDQTATVTGVPNPAAQLTLTSESSSTSSYSTVSVGNPAPNSQLTLTSESSSTSSYSTVSVGNPAPNSQLTLTSESSSSSSSVPTYTIASSAIASNQLSLTFQSDVTSSAIATNQLTLTSQTQPHQTIVSSVYTTGADGRASLNVVSVTTAASSAPAPGSQMTVTTARSRTVLLTNSAGQVTGTSTVAAVSSTPTPGAPAAASQLALAGNFNKEDYFLALYLPKIIAVALQSLWSVTYAATKLMEPFYQLASIEGASAKHSLLTEYLASGVTIQSVTSMFEGRYVLGLSSLVYLLMSILVALISETMSIEPTAYCKTEISDRQPCNPIWILDLRITRAVQALLIILFLAMAAMAFINQRRQSGIESDPSRLAALTKLLGDRTFMDELRNIHPLASPAEVKNTLRGNVYRLGFYSAAPGHAAYGITKTSAQVSSGEDFIQSEIGYMAVQNPNAPAPPNPQRRSGAKKMIYDIVLLGLVCGLFAIILAYRLISDQNNSFNKFMNSEKFGPRFVLSGGAVVIGFGIKRIEHEIRVMETYRHMSQSPQPAERSVLTSLSQTTFTNLYIGMRRGQWFAVFTAFVTVCSEILVIAMSGIPQSSSQIADAYEACTYASLFILFLIALNIVAVMLRQASNPDMPRNPDTLANTLLYLCGSNMIQRHVDNHNDEMNDKQLRHEFNGKQFDFGWASGVDGRTRWTVNEASDRHRF